jgi:hypothetical protein
MRKFITVAIAAILAVLTLPAVQAQAAIKYWYKPGHPMRLFSVQPRCTGAWAIRGASGMFFLGAGHCFEQGAAIAGTDEYFGWVRRDEMPGDWNFGEMDALLVQPDPDVDALQEVPGFGRAVDAYSNAELTQAGRPIGMLGQGTGGFSVGVTVSGWWERIDFRGERVACATYSRMPGDSGAPVFTHDGQGRVTVAGMHVGWVANPLGTGPARLGCYITIDDLLWEFGAWLPLFSSLGAGTMRLAGPPADRADDVPVTKVDGDSDALPVVDSRCVF